MKELYKRLKELEQKWGIEAWNDICNYWASLDDKIRDLTKSRDKWKSRALEAETKLKQRGETNNVPRRRT